ncbi:MAG TPA: insulinase family protein, partial [Phenylobacterium sp.]|nr:insulinase family protein [Phenylobacterium sp.]
AKVAAGEIAAMTKAVEEPELARAKAQLKGSMFMAREHTLARAEQAAAHVLMFGKVLQPETLAAQVDAVTPADLARLAQSILAPRKSAVAVLGPKAAMKAAPAFDRALFG